MALPNVTHSQALPLLVLLLSLPPTSLHRQLIALTEGRHLAEGHSVNIYTDSQYAFDVVHDFGALSLATQRLPQI